MARRPFGGRPSDIAADRDGNLVAGAVLSAWTARTGGTQITDLRSSAGAVITTVTTDAAGAYLFQGPADGTSALWLDGGAGSRFLVESTDLTSRLTSVEAGGGSATSVSFGGWLYGDGSDGAITLHDGDVLHSGNYTDVTIVAGATVTVDPAPLVTGLTPVLVCCSGTFTINGTVDLRGQSRVDRLDNLGFAELPPDPDLDSNPAVVAPAPDAIFPGGGGGSSSVRPGSPAGSLSNRVRHPLNAYMRPYPGASGIGVSGSPDDTYYGGAPGDPGNWFLLFAKTISHGVNNLYRLDGGNGAPGGDDGTGSTGHGNCGGGGGGGGWWLTISDVLIGSANESGTGGAGGAGSGTGGNGTAGTTGHGIHYLNRV
jgi:hypothetical protein